MSRCDNRCHASEAMEPSAQLMTVSGVVSALVERLCYPHLSRRTPFGGADVHTVLDHIMGVAFVVGGWLRGAEPAAFDPPFVYGWVPASEFRSAMDDLVAAVRSPGALVRPVTTPSGELSGESVARVVALDMLAYGWGIAGAAGIGVAVPASVVDSISARPTPLPAATVPITWAWRPLVQGRSPQMRSA